MYFSFKKKDLSAAVDVYGRVDAAGALLSANLPALSNARFTVQQNRLRMVVMPFNQNILEL